jgi:hypothetical protein
MIALAAVLGCRKETLLFLGLGLLLLLPYRGCAHEIGGSLQVVGRKGHESF